MENKCDLEDKLRNGENTRRRHLIVDNLYKKLNVACLFYALSIGYIGISIGCIAKRESIDVIAGSIYLSVFSAYGGYGYKRIMNR